MQDNRSYTRLLRASNLAKSLGGLARVDTSDLDELLKGVRVSKARLPKSADAITAQGKK